MISKTQGNIIRILWNEGKDVGTIAKVANVSRDGVYGYVNSHRNECRQRRKGRKKGLDWEKITCAWYEVEKRGTPVKEVAEMFGVTTTTIYRWVDLYRKGRANDTDRL